MSKHLNKTAPRALIKQGIFYSMLVGIESVAPFLLLPFLTRFLTPIEYGYWVLFVALTSFMRPLLGLTLQDAVRMRFFEMDHRNLSQFVTTASLIATAILIFSIALFSFSTTLISSFLKFPGEWIWTILVTAYLHGLYYTLLALLQFREQRKQFAWAQICHSSFALLLTIAFVVAGYDWRGAVVGKLLSLVITVLFVNRFFLRDLEIGLFSRFNLSYCKQLLFFGIRYLPAGLSAVIIPLTDRLLIAHIVNVEETSYFGIGGLFNMAIWVFVNGYIFALQPMLFRALQFDQQKVKDTIKLMSLFYFILPITGVIVFFLAHFLSPLLIGPKFMQTNHYIFWLIIAGVIQGVFTYHQTYLHCKKMVAMMSACALLAILLNAIFGWIFTEEYGGIGTAWATCLAYTVAAFVSGFIVLRSLSVDKLNESNQQGLLLSNIMRS